MYKRRDWKNINKQDDSAGSQEPVKMAAKNPDVLKQPINVDIEVPSDNYQEALKDVLKEVMPEWRRDEIQFEPLVDGHVNLMMTASTSSNPSLKVVTRVFCTSLEFLEQMGVDRVYEPSACAIFSEIGIGPAVLGTFKNGIISEFISGTIYKHEDVSPFRNEKLRHAVARAIAKVHCQDTLKLAVKYKFDKKTPSLFDMMSALGMTDWAGQTLIDEETTDWFNGIVPPLEERKKEVAFIIETLKSVSLPEVFCHADVNPTNIIYIEEEDKVIFVDFEMSCLSFPVMDTSAFLDGAASGFEADPSINAFSTEVKKDFLRVYLKERNRLDTGVAEVEEAEVDKYHDFSEMTMIGMNYFTPMVVPTFVMTGKPRSYLEVALGRLKYYNENKDRMLSFSREEESP